MAPRGLFVTGTDTGAGKTLVSSAILRALSRRGLRVAAFKPVETGCLDRDGERIGEDCVRLAAAANSGQAPADVAAALFLEPAAPLVAAEAEGRAVSRDEVLSRYAAIAQDADFVLVESAGGLLVPLADGWTTRDLARELGLPAVCVVASRLGCINHALLTLEVLRGSGIPVAGWILNEVAGDGAYPLALSTNRDTLRRFTAERDLGAMPFVESARTGDFDLLASLAEANLDLDALVAGA